MSVHTHTVHLSFRIGTLTKVLHFAIGKPMAHHGKFAIKNGKINIGKLWQTQSHKTPWQKAVGLLQATKEWQITAFLPFLV